MKKLNIIFLIILLPIFSFAQDKATLTKNETINYLNKKMKENIGHYKTPKGGTFKVYFLDSSFGTENDLVELSSYRSNYTSKNYNCDYYQYKNFDRFNPAHIISIESVETVKSEPLGIIKVILVSKTGIQTLLSYAYQNRENDGSCFNLEENSNKEYSVQEVNFPFLKGDPTNFNKIKKALEHLRNLYKNEDDPFGE